MQQREVSVRNPTIFMPTHLWAENKIYTFVHVERSRELCRKRNRKRRKSTRAMRHTAANATVLRNHPHSSARRNFRGKSQRKTDNSSRYRSSAKNHRPLFLFCGKLRKRLSQWIISTLRSYLSAISYGFRTEVAGVSSRIIKIFQIQSEKERR